MGNTINSGERTSQPTLRQAAHLPKLGFNLSVGGGIVPDHLSIMMRELACEQVSELAWFVWLAEKL